MRDAFRDAMSRFPTGVSIVTTRSADGTPRGTTANAVASVSLEPPQLLVCLAHTSKTLHALRAHGGFAINILSSIHEEVARGFARSGAVDVWDDLPHAAGPSGSPLIAGSLAVIDCEVADVFTSGDHDIVVGRVLHVAVDAADADALVFHRSRFGSFAA
jgi:flavin reductase (DIM6/NTAB) family NADH-FMN oxidoreductase RutF